MQDYPKALPPDARVGFTAINQVRVGVGVGSSSTTPVFARVFFFFADADADTGDWRASAAGGLPVALAGSLRRALVEPH